MKKLLGVVVGAVVAVAAIMGLEYLNHQIFPWTVADPGDIESIRAAVEAAPVTSKTMLVGGYFLGALAGGLIAVRIAGWAAAGWIVALLVVAGGVANLAMIPHPLWMQVGTVAAPLLAGLVVRSA
ncbi:MAG: hypothetical protein WDN24_21560 [Sphingomonas sp.]